MLSMNLFISSIKNAFVFSGKSNKIEFANYLFFEIIYSVLFSIFIFLIFGFTNPNSLSEPCSIPFLLSWAFTIILAIPSFSLGVRRLYDINKSGWFYLLILIPIVRSFLTIPLCFVDSENLDNKSDE